MRCLYVNPRIASPARTKAIIQKYNFFFKKNFGQNFLIETSILEKIISSSNITKDDCVLEVGPGIGSLTQFLAENAKKVIAVEIDKNLIPILEDTLSEYNNIEIINQDILKVDLRTLIEEKNNGKPIKVAANLPYYITTPIVMGLLEQKLPVDTITVMIQKEVADRMQAKPSTKDYGVLSLAVQYYCEPEIVVSAPAHCFMPQPNVDSSVIKLKVLEKPRVNVENEEFLFKLIKAAFAQRRKTLINCLTNNSELKLSKQVCTDALKKAELNPQVRGEALPLEEFAKLSDILCKSEKIDIYK